MTDLITSESLWNWQSPAWLVALAMLMLYGWLCRGQASGRSILVVLSAAVLVLAFVSPVGVLADGYLFSAHMIQHLLLLLVVPLLFWMAIPPGRFDQMPVGTAAARVGRVLSIPFVPWLCGLGAMWFWHVPSLCNAATENTMLGILRSVTFLLAGLAFWWPIFSPRNAARMQPLESIAYLFSACIGCTLLGIYITFASVSVCPAFADPSDRIRIMSMLYEMGMTPGADQQLGGLLMWVPPCSLYILVIIGVLCRWYTQMPTSETVRGDAGETLPVAVEGAQQ